MTCFETWIRKEGRKGRKEGRKGRKELITGFLGPVSGAGSTEDERKKEAVGE